MTIEKNIHGYWVVSDIVRGHLERRVYIGYTKRKAAQHFRQEMRGAK